MDAADLELFRRSLQHATANGTGEALDLGLEELGWRDALSMDPRAAVSVLFELQGAGNVTSSALDQVLAGALGRHGQPTTGVVLPALGAWGPPGTVDGQRLVIRGLGTAALARHDSAVVVGVTGDRDVVVTVATAELGLRVVHGADPWLGLVEVTGEVAYPRAPAADAESPDWPAADAASPDWPAADAASPDWQRAVALGQLAVGHELVGAARTMLELARQHTLERVQFGRPIAMFQAVRHRLAETLVAIEMADALLLSAWDDGSPLTAAMAKALAGRGARTAARHCQQVLAGIGFTTEHPLHRYVRRVLVLDQLFGSARTLTRTLGQDLLATGRLPPLFPL